MHCQLDLNRLLSQRKMNSFNLERVWRNGFSLNYDLGLTYSEKCVQTMIKHGSVRGRLDTCLYLMLSFDSYHVTYSARINAVSSIYF